MNVLIVEDDPAVALLASFIVKREFGFRVDHHRQVETVGCLDNFDIVILDALLPGGTDGITFGREIRDLYPDMPIIFITGCTDAHNNVVFASITPYIVHKPLSINAKELKQVISTCAAIH